MPKGVDIMFDSVITVFSASNYCGLVQNFSACVHIDKNMDIQFNQFPPLPYLKRSDVIFAPTETTQKRRRNPEQCFSSTQALISPPQAVIMQHPKTIHPKTQSTRAPHLSNTLSMTSLRKSGSRLEYANKRSTSSQLFQ